MEDRSILVDNCKRGLILDIQSELLEALSQQNRPQKVGSGKRYPYLFLSVVRLQNLLKAAVAASEIVQQLAGAFVF